MNMVRICRDLSEEGLEKICLQLEIIVCVFTYRKSTSPSPEPQFVSRA